MYLAHRPHPQYLCQNVVIYGSSFVMVNKTSSTSCMAFVTGNSPHDSQIIDCDCAATVQVGLLKISAVLALTVAESWKGLPSNGVRLVKRLFSCPAT